MAVKPIPDGYSTVTPYLIVRGASELIDFVKDAFGAEERGRMEGPDGTIGHAEVKIGDSVIMIADGNDEWPSTPAMLHLYVEDCDSVFERALKAGAKSVREPEDQFYGDRSATVTDSFGNSWSLATHVEDVPREEMERRAKEWAERG
jgi:PhnB protein